MTIVAGLQRHNPNRPATRFSHEPGRTHRLSHFRSRPELIVAELANTYWKYLRATQLSRLQVDSSFQQSLALIDDLCPLLPLS